MVEAWENTTQPLVLTIYHGTNQIAQTSLYLSISGVEQMFRYKILLLNSESSAVADRLTDASVPNEPDTTDKNFVFLHGYNVNPQQARGVLPTCISGCIGRVRTPSFTASFGMVTTRKS